MLAENWARNFEIIENQVFIMKRQIGVNGTISQNVYFLKMVAIFENNLTLFKELLLQIVDKSLQCIGAQVFEIHDV